MAGDVVPEEEVVECLHPPYVFYLSSVCLQFVHQLQPNLGSPLLCYLRIALRSCQLCLNRDSNPSCTRFSYHFP